MIVDVSSVKLTPIIDSIRLEKIDDKDYFSEKYSDYISNSRLSLLKSKGAQAFFDGIESEYNPSFSLGTNIHALYLQPEFFELIDTVFKPTAKAGIMADYLYKEDGNIPTDDDIKIASIKCNYYKDKLTLNRLTEFKNKAFPYWRDRFCFESKNPIGEKERIYTDEKSVNIIKNCLAALGEVEEFNKLMHPSFLVEEPYSANEQALLLDLVAEIPNYEPVTYKLKAKVDNFVLDKEDNCLIVNDLKTTSKEAQYFDPTYFSYQRELSFYAFMLKIWAKKYFSLNPTIKGNFFVVSTQDFSTLLYPMTDKLFIKGWQEVNYLLKTVAYLNIVNGYQFKN